MQRLSSEVDSDALAFPIPIPGGLKPLGAAKFSLADDQRFRGATFRRFRQGALRLWSQFPGCSVVTHGD